LAAATRSASEYAAAQRRKRCSVAQIGRHGRFVTENKGLLRTNCDGTDVALNGAGAAVVSPGLDGTVVVVHTCPGVQLGLGDGD
jgi:hypothetical protein